MRGKARICHYPIFNIFNSIYRSLSQLNTQFPCYTLQNAFHRTIRQHGNRILFHSQFPILQRRNKTYQNRLPIPQSPLRQRHHLNTNLLRRAHKHHPKLHHRLPILLPRNHRRHARKRRIEFPLQRRLIPVGLLAPLSRLHKLPIQAPDRASKYQVSRSSNRFQHGRPTSLLLGRNARLLCSSLR